MGLSRAEREGSVGVLELTSVDSIGERCAVPDLVGEFKINIL